MRPGLPDLAPPSAAARSPRLRRVLMPLAVAGLPFVLLLWIAIHQSLAITRQVIEENLLGQARVLAALIDNETETYLAVARALAATPALRDGDLGELAQVMRAAMTALPTSFATLFDEHGRPLITTRNGGGVPAGTGAGTAIPDVHARVRESGQMAVSNLFDDAFGTGRLAAVVVAAPIPGMPMRTIAVSMRPSRFHGILAATFPANAFVGVVDREGRFVARMPDHDQYLGVLAADDRRAAFQRDPHGVYEGRTREGVRIVAGYWTTENGWVAGVGYPAAVVEAPLLRLQWVLGIAGLLVLAASVALAAWTHRRIRGSADRLVEAAAALRGNQAPASVVTGVREYDEVARTLADAGAALRERTALLAASEARYRELSDAMPQLVWTADAEGRMDHANRQRDRYFPMDAGAGSWADITHPDDVPAALAAWEAARASGQPLEVEHRLRLADGRWHWHLTRALPQRDEAGRVIRWFGTATDVDANKRREHEAHYLLREVNHRSKNLLAIAQAMTRQTALDEHPETMAETLCDRFAALSLSQDLLLRGEWLRVPLDEVVRVQLAHFAPVIGSRIRIDGPALRVNPTAAQAIGMALHELATNATKYGALSGDTGRIEVRWWLEPDAGDGERFRMRWQESEGPPVAAPAHHGFGQFVMVRMVEQTLGGRIALDYPAQGVVWELDAPAVAALEETSPRRDDGAEEPGVSTASR